MCYGFDEEQRGKKERKKKRTNRVKRTERKALYAPLGTLAREKRRSVIGEVCVILTGANYRRIAIIRSRRIGNYVLRRHNVGLLPATARSLISRFY